MTRRVSPAEAPDPVRARLRECPDCGLFQTVPAPAPGVAALCPRCDTVLRRGRTDPLTRPLAMGAAGCVLALIATTAPLMEVSKAGLSRDATLLTGPDDLGQFGLWELSVVIIATTVAVPLLHLGALTYVLLAVRRAATPSWLPRLFALTLRLRRWSMIEVYLVGVFVAYTKLRSLVFIEVGPALWALVALMLAVIAADLLLDPEAVWQAMEHRVCEAPPATVPAGGRVGCDVCGAVWPGSRQRCGRCHARLRRRKPDPMQRTAALAVAALVLYVPANVYPVLTYMQFGAGSPSTILGGARELLEGGQWPLALIVFVASVAVPVLKLVGLFLMLATTRRGVAARLHDRTRLYRVIEFIGRWSMIDIFMESILVALVQFGGVVTILPGVGAVAFAAVVVLTMIAAESFDPRLMWDAARFNPA